MRVKRGYVSRRRHGKVLKASKGFRGRRNNCFKLAKDAVEKSLQYAYRDRRVKKREFRALWIQRINAASRACGLSYGQFMHGLKQSGVDLDRKSLSELAIHDQAAFAQLVEQARTAVSK